MAELRFLPPAAKYLKKLKDKQLKKLFEEKIRQLQLDPFIGEEKKGDLKGVRCCDIYYTGTNYELAYTVEYITNTDTAEPEIVVIIMAGTRENFYEQLKNYMY